MAQVHRRSIVHRTIVFTEKPTATTEKLSATTTYFPVNNL